MLKSSFSNEFMEAGCDEAGRGCLAGPVCAAAVIFPVGYVNEDLNDSKQLAKTKRNKLRTIIEKDALAWGVAMVDNVEIDKINILNASFLAMHKALDALKTVPQLIIVDGNKFKKYKNIPHQCIVKGDGKYLSIAAASVLAKTYRDDYMEQLDKEFPLYKWSKNKGYPTLEHRKAIMANGSTPYHRKTFSVQIKLWE